MNTYNQYNGVKIIEPSENKVHTYSENGFTLIEVMIALVILLIGMLGVMGMQYYAVVGNTSSREMRIATSLAQERIEQLKLIPLINLDNDTDEPSENAEQSLYAGQSYTRRWWVVPNCVALRLGANDDPDPCDEATAAECNPNSTVGAAVVSTAIRARTCWADKNGNWHSVSIDSLRTN